MTTATSRFSWTRTDISELDIEYLLENSTALGDFLPQAHLGPHVAVDGPRSPLDGAFDDVPALSPSSSASSPASESSLPYFGDSPANVTMIPDTPDTPLASRQRHQPVTSKATSDIPLLSLSSYSFPPPRSDPGVDVYSASDSRSSTPTPNYALSPPSPPPKLAALDGDKWMDGTTSKARKSREKDARASTIMVELDDFFPHKPSNTFTPFRTFAPPSSLVKRSQRTSSYEGPLEAQERKGSLAPSFFSTASTSSSSFSASSTHSRDSGSIRAARTRQRSRSTSNRSTKSSSAASTREPGGGDMEFEVGGGIVRQPKLAAYPRYVPPKPTKQSAATSQHDTLGSSLSFGMASSGRTKLRLFGGR